MSLLSTAARTVADWVKLGYPESVAKRIVSGDLPMDRASRLKRAEEQGYGDVLYHGSTHDIREFSGKGNPQNDWGEGTYLTDSTHDASTNYSGTHGADFKSRWFEEKERLEADYDSGERPDLDDGDGSFDDWKAREEAINKFKGENDGVIYPVRVKQEGLLSTVSDIDRPDYLQQAREELGLQGIEWSDLTDEAENALWDMEDALRAGDYSHPQYSVSKVTGEYGVSDAPHLDDHETWSSVRDVLLNEYAEDEAGNYVGAGRMVGEMLQDLGAKGVYDPTSVRRFDSMESGKHTIIFPGNENQIRSVSAAFDPQYTGRNILGGATPGMMAAVAGTAGGASGIAALRNDVLNQLAAAKTVKERGDIRAPNSETLHKVTMAARDLERRLEGHPAGWLFPGGMLEYLEQANREERPSAMTRAMAFLDVL